MTDHCILCKTIDRTIRTAMERTYGKRGEVLTEKTMEYAIEMLALELCRQLGKALEEAGFGSLDETTP